LDGWKRVGTDEGALFWPSDYDALDNIFFQIDEMEKAEIIENRYTETQDYYRAYLMWGMVFFFLWMGLKSSFLNNFLLD
jgi:Ca-activated chloride channel homolog